MTALLAGLLLVAPTASAIEYGGVGGRPANPDPKVPKSNSIFIYKIALGDTKQDAVTVINNTQRPKTLQIYAVDSLVSSGGALACKQKAEDRDEVDTWISLSQSEVTLQPLSNTDVSFDVTVPATDVSPGEHNGCIVVQAKNQTSQKDGGGIALTTRTAMRVQVTVPGKVKQGMEFAGYRIVEKNEDYLINIKVKNIGNVSTDADIKTSTRYFFGLPYDKRNSTFNVLPFVTAEYNFDLKRPFWGFLYTSKPSLSYDADPGPGKDVRKAEGNRVWFWVWPKPLAALIELVVLALIVGGVFLYRRRKEEDASLDGWQAYRVKKRDTLTSVAKARGTSARLLARANNVKRSYQPKAGQSIKAPRKSK